MQARRPFHNKGNLDSGFGLAFLDVLCCGLGAAVLLLLIVKHEPPSVISENFMALLAPQISSYRNKADLLEQTIQKERQEVLKLEQELARINQEWKNIDQINSGFVNKYIDLSQEIDKQRDRQNSLEAALDAARNVAERQTKSPKNEISLPQGAIEGIQLSDLDRVVILFDTSTSMLHRSLVEIIRLRVSAPEIKKQSKKWRQAIGVLKWSVDAVSRDMRYKVFTFSDRVFELDGSEVQAAPRAWDKKTYDVNDVSKYYSQIDRLLPDKGTNLSKALDAASSLTPRPKKILIVTDGLPSLINKVPREELKGCPKRKSRKNNLIDGTCRLSVAIESIESLSQQLSGVPVDVILLPLDGDRDAIRFYSLVTSISSGRLLTPSPDWML